ncbi:MAG: TIGR02147 family protein [Myxococcales bacterium]|nr:TIGR02147 family protein [Myxococcales bacterium]
MARRSNIDVYRYLDYRALLRDYYEDRKKHGRGFSYRAFSAAAGLRSPNHLKRVIDGERNLPSEMAMRFADACGFEGDEARYFCELAAFNQAQTTREKRARYESLCRYRGFRRAHKLDVAQAEYHENWYLPAIRELAASRGFREDPAWLAKQLLPPISKAEAKRALQLLETMGLLVRDADGKLGQSEAVVSTGAETAGVHIVNYHRTMMDRAIEAVDLVPRSKRDISALTLCLTSEGLTDLKKRVQEFRRELVGLEGADGQGTIVVQMNFQLYPLSVVPEEEAS